MIQIVRIKFQIKNTPGCLGIELRKTHGLSFWTKTLWQDEKSLQLFSHSGAHKQGMHRLRNWCNEAVHAHWDYESRKLPSWEEAEKALIDYGRLSSVDYPTQSHQAGKINIK